MHVDYVVVYVCHASIKGKGGQDTVIFLTYDDYVHINFKTGLPPALSGLCVCLSAPGAPPRRDPWSYRTSPYRVRVYGVRYSVGCSVPVARGAAAGAAIARLRPRPLYPPYARYAMGYDSHERAIACCDV